MAGDPWKKVARRGPLRMPAVVYNAMLDHVREVPTDFGVEPVGSRRAPVWIRNDSGVAVGEFGVLGLDGPVIMPAANLAEFKREPFFKGVTPAAAHGGKFAVLLDPAAAGRIVPAIAAGIVPVRVTGAAADYAEVIAGDAAKLAMAAAGSARVLWAEAGSGERWAVVRLGERQTVNTFSGASLGLTANLAVSSSSPASGFVVPWTVNVPSDTKVYQTPNTYFQSGDDGIRVASAGCYLFSVNATVIGPLGSRFSLWLEPNLKIGLEGQTITCSADFDHLSVMSQQFWLTDPAAFVQRVRVKCVASVPSGDAAVVAGQSYFRVIKVA